MAPGNDGRGDRLRGHGPARRPERRPRRERLRAACDRDRGRRRARRRRSAGDGEDRRGARGGDPRFCSLRGGHRSGAGDARRTRPVPLMPDRQRSKAELNEELLELLNELRVALPGVQVLFAFLLAVPFQARFGQVTSFQRDVYFFTLSCAAIATALLIAPSAYHRINFRMRDKETLLLISNRLTIMGIGVLGLAIVGVMVLISDVLYGTAGAIVAGAGAAALF